MNIGTSNHFFLQCTGCLTFFSCLLLVVFLTQVEILSCNDLQKRKREKSGSGKVQEFPGNVRHQWVTVEGQLHLKNISPGMQSRHADSRWKNIYHARKGAGKLKTSSLILAGEKITSKLFCFCFVYLISFV